MPYVPRNRYFYPNASQIDFLPSDLLKWLSNPGTVELALNELGSRLYEVEINTEGSPTDASLITYTPSDEALSCWYGSSDPGNVDSALDQIILRLCDIEAGFVDSGLSGYSGYSGYSGATGYSGISGYSGYSGAIGGDSQPFTWTTVTGSANTGEVGVNNATYSSINTLWIDIYNQDLISISAWVNNLANPNNVIKVFGRNNPNNFIHMRVNSTSKSLGDNTEIGLSVVYITHNGTFSNGDNVIVTMANGGSSGTSGYSGYSGRSGFSGYSGSGISGYSGYSGISGYSGYSGISGYSGDSGISGYSGYSGSGISGYSGYSGSGISGYSGYSGISGYSGYSGLNGTPAGSNSEIQYNNSGVFGASPDLSWNNVSKKLIIGAVVGNKSTLNIEDLAANGDVEVFLPDNANTSISIRLIGYDDGNFPVSGTNLPFPDSFLGHVAWRDILSTDLPSNVAYLDVAQIFTASQTFNPTNNSSVGVIVQGLSSQSASLQEWKTVTPVTVSLISANGDWTVSPIVRTTGSPTLATVTGPAHTTLTASTEATDINLNLARTVQFATGALTTQRAIRIQAPTYSFVGSSTLTTASTVSISGAPVAGTNATITNTLALNVESGRSRFSEVEVFSSGNSSAYFSYGDSTGPSLNKGIILNWTTTRSYIGINTISGTFATGSRGWIGATADYAISIGVGGFVGLAFNGNTESFSLGSTPGVGTIAGAWSLTGSRTYGNVLNTPLSVRRGSESGATGTPDLIRAGTNAATYLFRVLYNGDLLCVPEIRTTGSPTLVTVTGPAHTTLTASTEATDINLNLARTVQFATGALTTQRAIRIQAPTYGFVGSSTLTTASTVSISGAPVAGTNATITNTYALQVESGVTRLNGGQIAKRTATAVSVSADYDDYIIGVTSTASVRTITLPTAVNVAGRVYIVKDESGGAATNNITIATTSSQTIDGASTKVINTNYGFYWVYSDGANWFTI